MKRPEKLNTDILFLVSPNYGLLDNWLPVLYELKKRKPDVKITAIFPRSEIVFGITPEEVTTRLGDLIFNKVIFKSRAGFWVLADNLVHAKKLNEKSRIVNVAMSKIRTAIRLYGGSAPAKPIAYLVEKMIRFVTPVLTGEKHINLDEINRQPQAICFDLYAKTKKNCREVLDFFPKTPRFSILHGLAIADYEIKRGNTDINRTYKITAYLHSEYERPAYKRNYGLKDSEIKIVGVVRHDPLWIEKIIQTKNDVPKLWDKYIFVISRPAIDNFLPRENKKEALENIKKLAFKKLNCRVVVKLHPTEQKEGLYEEVFGKDAYGNKWIYSHSHPFLLGKNSMFAVSFYSGVAVDLLALGVITIQLLNLKPGQPGGFSMDYQKKGLVLMAHNYDELKNHASDILERKSNVMLTLLYNYRDYFAPIRKPINIIVEDICKEL